MLHLFISQISQGFPFSPSKTEVRIPKLPAAVKTAGSVGFYVPCCQLGGPEVSCEFQKGSQPRRGSTKPCAPHVFFESTSILFFGKAQLEEHKFATNEWPQ